MCYNKYLLAKMYVVYYTIIRQCYYVKGQS